MVDVVTEHPRRNVYDQMMHISVLSLFPFAVCQRVHGINGMRAFVRIPFVFAQPMVIFGVNDGEFAFCQRNLSEGIAEAQPAEDKQDWAEMFFYELADSKNNLVDFPAPSSVLGLTPSPVLCAFGPVYLCSYICTNLLI